MNPQYLKHIKSLQRKGDLPSFRESLQHHFKLYQAGLTGKFFITKDQQSLAISNRVLKTEFARDNFLRNPGQNVKQCESLLVKVTSIEKNKILQVQYDEWAKNKKKENRIISIGGPAAQQQTLMSCLIPSIAKSSEILYLTQSYLESNIMHSSWQVNARQGTALNASSNFTGRKILGLYLKRIVNSKENNIGEFLNMPYMAININRPNWRSLQAFLRVQMNGLIQKIRGRMFPKMRTEHDIGRLDAVVSRQIQMVLQRTFDLKYIPHYQKFYEDSRYKQVMTIQIYPKQAQQSLLQSMDREYRRTPCHNVEKMDKEQLKSHFPQEFLEKYTLRGARHLGDYSNNFDIYERTRSKSIQLGAQWDQNHTLKQVLVRKNPQTNKIQACGVLFESGKFIPGNKVHLSLGYKAKFVYQDGTECLSSYNIPVTGSSCNFLLRITPFLRQNLLKHGDFHLIYGGSLHLTTVQADQEYLILRGAAGANIDRESYCPQFFLYMIYAVRQMFGDALVGVLSVYGCPRAVNFKNTSQFAKLAEGLLISYGKGGTGGMKRACQAYKVLSQVGYKNQLDSYFSKIPNPRLNIPESVEQVCKQSWRTGLIYDNSELTKRKI